MKTIELDKIWSKWWDGLAFKPRYIAADDLGDGIINWYLYEDEPTYIKGISMWHSYGLKWEVGTLPDLFTEQPHSSLHKIV